MILLGGLVTVGKPVPFPLSWAARQLPASPRAIPTADYSDRLLADKTPTNPKRKRGQSTPRLRFGLVFPALRIALARTSWPLAASRGPRETASGHDVVSLPSNLL